MRKLIVLLVAVLGFVGTVNAEPNMLSRTLEDQATMMEIAKGLVVESVGKENIGDAIGMTTAALDIARAEGNEEMASDIEELLAAYRVINLMTAATMARKGGDELAAREIMILACKKAGEVTPRLLYLVREVRNFCTPT